MTSPPSPTKQAVPQVRTHCTAARRASELELQSTDLCAPSPWVRSRIASTTSFFPGSITSSGPELLGELQAFITNVEGDYPRAHRLGELRRAQSDRALPENRNGFVTRKIEPL